MDENKREDLLNIPENILDEKPVPGRVGERPLNELQRMVQMIISPGQALADIKERPHFLWMMLLLIALNAVVTAMSLPELKEFTRPILISQGGESLTPEMVEFSLQMIGVGAIVAVIVMVPLKWLLTAAVLAVYNLLAGGMASFKQLFALSVYTYIPAIFSLIIFAVVVKTMGYDGAMQVNTSLALLLGAEDEGFWFLFLSQLELFTFWSYVLLIMGAALVMKKNVFSLGIVLIIFWLALSAGIAAFGSLGAVT